MEERGVRVRLWRQSKGRDGRYSYVVRIPRQIANALRAREFLLYLEGGRIVLEPIGEGDEVPEVREGGSPGGVREQGEEVPQGGPRQR